MAATTAVSFFKSILVWLGEGPLYNRVFLWSSHCEGFIHSFNIWTEFWSFWIRFYSENDCTNIFVIPLLIICTCHFLGISIGQGSDQMVVIKVKEEALLSFTIRVMKQLKYRDDRRSPPPVFVFVFLNFPFYSYHNVSFLNWLNTTLIILFE